MKPVFAKILFVVLTAYMLISCDNIFSPKLDESNSNELLTDQKTIEGFFTNFRYAYTFKDTSIYSALLTDDFIFTYYDYENGFEVSWDKPTEMRTTSRLFQNSQKTDIIWNNIVVYLGDSLNVNVKRSFNLTITFNPSNVVRLYGFADMNFTRQSADGAWRILKWKDESF
ncbi:MAG: hypothetical protein L0Y76_11065 [Ignavibacteria bacterium]|nr:hypothetical protein [Ignavibacteria bacterium]